MKLAIAFAVWLLFLSSFTPMSVESRRRNVQLCGRSLADAVNLFCRGRYYDPEERNRINKREVGQQMRMSDFYPESKPGSDPVGWFLGLPPQDWSRHQYPGSLRQERGIVDDCCKKPCSISVLMSYCESA